MLHKLEVSQTYYCKTEEKAEWIRKLLDDLQSLIECSNSEQTATITPVEKYPA